MVDDHDLDEIVSEIIDYTWYHFEREEVIMEICKYSNLIVHKARHKSLQRKSLAWHTHGTTSTT